ncbi:MAG: N-6 DNA methylase, partial [Candidatus Cloacimonadota bacterium]|nr:N-6 DNA methylase [Candidatus Cloacimonadota bacterium]
MSKVTYNERSWAIDTISEITLYASANSRSIKGAGGESTINTGKKRYFPDVLLLGGSEDILMGWELKMPDTKINDAELISNASKKATILQKDSFILWNVKSAVLYVKNKDEFEILKSWDDISINSRIEVKANEILWKELLFQILEDLNSFFESGEIKEVTSSEIISIDEVISVILENTSNVAEEIKIKGRSNARLEAQINSWWRSSYSEYGYKDIKTTHKLPTLSMVVLTDWVFKIVFAHILKSHFNKAKSIENIQGNTTISEALDIIVSISQSCNFWNIFSPNLAQKHISEMAWNQIVELNLFLSNINLDEIDIDILQQLLQSAVISTRRKIAGQFSTPQELADLLTRLTVENKTKTVLDPCCGTGTIIKKAYQLKEEYELTQDEILDTIWASDKHSFPIQLSTLSLAKPENFGKIINIFTKDVIDLHVNNQEEFRDPNSGELVNKAFPKIDYIVSNLPFIKSKDMKILNPNIIDINSWIQEETGENLTLSGKSDI